VNGRTGTWVFLRHYGQMSRWVLQIIRDHALHNIFFLCGATAQTGLRSPFLSFLFRAQVDTDTHTHTRQDSLSKWSARRGGRYLHRKHKGRDAFRGIRTRASRSQGAAHLSLRPHGHWDRLPKHSVPIVHGRLSRLTRWSPCQCIGFWHRFTVFQNTSHTVLAFFLRDLSPVNRFPEVHPSPQSRKTGSCTNSVYGKQNCLPKWKDRTSVDQGARINNGILQAENQYCQISWIYIIIYSVAFQRFPVFPHGGTIVVFQYGMASK
jgi:hypothetical protein